jgi:hypothetical protein
MDYYLHNTSRSRHTKAQRLATAERRGAKQFFGESRLLRGRPLTVTEVWILANLEELRRKVAGGLIEIRLADGRALDLATLQPQGIVIPSPPLPCPVPDSIKNDPPSGIPMPIYPGGAVQSIQALPEPAPEGEEADVEFRDSSAGTAQRGKKHRR